MWCGYWKRVTLESLGLVIQLGESRGGGMDVRGKERGRIRSVALLVLYVEIRLTGRIEFGAEMDLFAQ